MIQFLDVEVMTASFTETCWACWSSSGLKHVPQCPEFRLINASFSSCVQLHLTFKGTPNVNVVYNHFLQLSYSFSFNLSGMVLSLRLRIPVPREKEALPLTWHSWTSSASSLQSL